MKRIVFEKGAFDDFTDWAKRDNRIHKRIVALITDILRQPYRGIGKPEPLKHDLHGYWSRRINDEPGFCKSATREEISRHGFVLTPGRYVGTEAAEDDVPFVERFAELQMRLNEQFKGDVRLQGIIRNNLARLGTTLGTDTGDDA